MISLKQFFWKFWYQYLSRRIGHEPVIFLNYGFWPPEGETLSLESGDEPNRPAIQLYHRLVRDTNLEGRDVLEVSCGHGGGASFLNRYHRPRTYTAVDQNPRAIAFDRQIHGALGIDFRTGDAQALDFSENAFDVALNLEASHCYPRQDRFFRSVARVLRPGGTLCWADFRLPSEVSGLEADMDTAGFRIRTKADITTEVLEALRRTSEAYRNLVRRFTPRFLHRAMDTFAAVEGSPIYNSFVTGHRVYLVYCLEKS